MAMPDAFVEVIDTTPTSVTARHNHPIEPFLGPGGRSNGVSGDEISTMLRALDDVIAEWNGVGLEREVQSEYDVLTIKTKYGPIRASDRIRWNRNAYLSWLTSLQLLSMRMESGMTAQEAGAADAEKYGPGWGSQTPWQLYRGMVWNWMTDPDADCEALSASPDEVHARCREHYRDMVEGSQEYHNVTPEDVFESGRAFAVGVADPGGAAPKNGRDTGGLELHDQPRAGGGVVALPRIEALGRRPRVLATAEDPAVIRKGRIEPTLYVFHQRRRG